MEVEHLILFTRFCWKKQWIEKYKGFVTLLTQNRLQLMFMSICSISSRGIHQVYQRGWFGIGFNPFLSECWTRKGIHKIGAKNTQTSTTKTLSRFFFFFLLFLTFLLSHWVAEKLKKWPTFTCPFVPFFVCTKLTKWPKSWPQAYMSSFSMLLQASIINPLSLLAYTSSFTIHLVFVAKINLVKH